MAAKTSVLKVGATAAAHRATVSESVSSVVGFLVDLLGSQLIARLAGVDPSSVSRWKTGVSEPQLEIEQRLRGAHQVAHLLLTVDSDSTVRAWFIGMNPQLADETPLDVIAAGKTKVVLSAARTFINAA